jgi:hypothetical protein
MPTTPILIGLTLTLLLLTAYWASGAHWPPRRANRSTTTKPTGTTIANRPSATLHDAPDTPFTPEQAHRVIRLHAGCNPDRCARTSAALDILAEAGHIRLERKEKNR